HPAWPLMGKAEGPPWVSGRCGTSSSQRVKNRDVFPAASRDGFTAALGKTVRPSLRERYDQFGRVAAAGDRDDERAQSGLLRDVGLFPRQHARHRDHEAVAEALAGVAREGVGELAHQV